MGLSKLILLVLFGWFVWWSYKRIKHQMHLLRVHQQRKAQHSETSKNKGVMMLACAKCGLHIPATEAVRAHGKIYCCREHAKH